jgi:hypothetical protein
MQTLEQRVERLERSCRRWRLGFVMAVLTAGAVGAAAPSAPTDAEFSHLTVQSLEIRGRTGGPVILQTCDNDHASIRLAAAPSAPTVDITAQKDEADLFLWHANGNGSASADLRVDGQTGTISVQNAAGKSRNIEPD